jgi:hypothetical protein
MGSKYNLFMYGLLAMMSLAQATESDEILVDEFERKSSRADLRQYPGSNQVVLRYTMRSLDQNNGSPTDIWTWDLLNRKKRWYPIENNIGVYNESIKLVVSINQIAEHKLLMRAGFGASVVLTSNVTESAILFLLTTGN